MLSEMKGHGRLLLALALLGTAGCSKTGQEYARVAVVPVFETRVSTLDFDRGDRIGLSIVRASAVYAENEPMTYDGTAFSGDAVWYADRTEPSTLTAYYPYLASGLPYEFSVAADQRAGYTASDLLGAVSEGVLPSAEPVTMVFCHLLSQLTVVVENRSAAAVAGVALSGFSPTARVDFGTLEVAAVPAGGGEVQACETEAGVAYRAILVPQCADLTVTVRMDDGSVHRKTIAQVALESRKRYALTVDIAADGVALMLGGEIQDWVDGGSIGSNAGGADEPEKDDGSGSGGGDGDDSETDDVRDAGGGCYRTVSVGGRLWMAENLRYMPQDAVPGSGVWYPKAGASAVAGRGLLYDRATALGSDEDGGLPVRGLCPAGWHLPSRAELESLAGADCGADFFADAGCWICSDLQKKYGSRSYLMSTTLSADGDMECLQVDAASGAGAIFPLPVEYGVSVRCVED